MIAARILGIERLVLTSAPNNYQTAIDQVDEFLNANNIKNMTIREMLDIFLSLVKNKNEWKKNSA